MQFENINKYIEATSKHLGVEDERYGGGYRAIVAHRCWVDFLFDKLEGDDLDGIQVQLFFTENPLFPAAYGGTASEALENLDKKLGALYKFEPKDGPYRWRAIPRYSLKAQHDCEPGEEQTYYDVDWDDVVSDLRTSSRYFYEDSKENSGPREKRNLHALINYRYEGDFNHLQKL
ncbi:hypothetical protein [Microbulbifer epialgicus]|uniref:Uncharacterized protein n=1 Tax=Microbulbifer epialgicus TaxID=393907 RepID=A0ABV4NV71_9GAMM